MKKVWKGAAAAVSAAALAATGFIGATTANAADVETITLSTTNPGATFNGYKVLDATYTGTGESQAVSYQLNSKYSATVAGLLGVTLSGNTNADNLAITNAIKAQQGSEATFANDLAAEISGTADATATADANGSAEMSVAPGYWLIVQDQLGTPSTAEDAKPYVKSNPILVTITDAPATVKLKNSGLPTPDKTVEYTVDGLTGEHDNRPFKVGDTLNFTLTGNLTDTIAGASAYTFKMTDRYTSGLDYNSDVVVTFHANDDDTTGTVVPAANYTVTNSSPAEADGDYTNELVIDFGDLKAADKWDGYNFTEDSKFVVKYSATVNANAANLEYNKLQVDHNGTTTPWDLVTLKGFTFGITKTFGGQALPSTNQPLSDSPEFTVYNYADGQVGTAAGTITTELNADGTNYYGELKNQLSTGTYLIRETTVPNGYVAAEDLILEVIYGIDDAQYGYKLYKLGDTAPENYKFVAGDATTRVLIIDTTIDNPVGSELPETGGMGTTVLYAAGAAIVLIAGIGLAIALRRRQA